MKKLLMLLAFFIGAHYSLLAQTPNGTSAFPVTLPRLIQVLKDGIDDDFEIIKIIKTRGVSFQMTPEIESELKKYKASPKLLAAIPENRVYASAGIVNGKAIDMVTPSYPDAARAVNATGVVNVSVSIDLDGNVIAASAISGHELLKPAAVKAALASKFAPFMRDKKKIRVVGLVVYNFTR